PFPVASLKNTARGCRSQGRCRRCGRSRTRCGKNNRPASRCRRKTRCDGLAGFLTDCFSSLTPLYLLIASSFSSSRSMLLSKAPRFLALFTHFGRRVIIDHLPSLTLSLCAALIYALSACKWSLL